MPIQQDSAEFRALERQVAYTAARADIESYCAWERHSGKYCGLWYDTQQVGPEWREYIEIAVRYLEARGLLEFHPKTPTLVRPLEDDGGAS